MTALLLLQSSAPSGSVPGIGDPAAIIIGTVLSVLVLFAIASAHRPPKS